MSKSEQTGSSKPVSAESPFAVGRSAFPSDLEVQAAVARGRRMQAQAILGLFTRLGK
jgi:hypothetical protein